MSKMLEKLINRRILLILVTFQVCLAFNITRLFLEEKLVPDIIPDPPQNYCRVFFPHGELQPGSNLTYNQTMDQPYNATWWADPNTNYTLYVSGVTGWKLPKERRDDQVEVVEGREWHSWIVINIPGNNLSAGEELYHWLHPGDSVKNQVHDVYMILIYKQQGPLFINKTNDKGWAEFQRNYRPHRFARRHRLGKPIAGNYYHCFYEDYKGQWDYMFHETKDD